MVISVVVLVGVLMDRMGVVDTGAVTIRPSIVEHMVHVPMIVAAVATKKKDMLIRLLLLTSVVEVQSFAIRKTESGRRRCLI